MYDNLSKKLYKIKLEKNAARQKEKDLNVRGDIHKVFAYSIKLDNFLVDLNSEKTVSFDNVMMKLLFSHQIWCCTDKEKIFSFRK